MVDLGILLRREATQFVVLATFMAFLKLGREQLDTSGLIQSKWKGKLPQDMQLKPPSLVGGLNPSEKY